jgi:hypothetical protein
VRRHWGPILRLEFKWGYTSLELSRQPFSDVFFRSRLDLKSNGVQDTNITKIPEWIDIIDSDEKSGHLLSAVAYDSPLPGTACGGSRAIITVVAGLRNTPHWSQGNIVVSLDLQSGMRRPLLFSTTYINPSESVQAKEGATTRSSLVPTTPAVTDEQKRLVPKLQKQVHISWQICCLLGLRESR